MFNVQCFFYAYFKITISRINHFKTITRVVVFTGCAWWQMFFDRRRWSGMFLCNGGQMSDSFANIGRICITQTCKLIYIGHQGHRGICITQTCKLIYDIGHQGHRGMAYPYALDGQCRISIYMFAWCKFYLYWQNYPTFGHQGKGTCHFIFCDQRTFVIMHNL